MPGRLISDETCFMSFIPSVVRKYGSYKAGKLHRWDDLQGGGMLGRKENLPVYKFLKEPLIRKFGKAWYEELELTARELETQGII